MVRWTLGEKRMLVRQAQTQVVETVNQEWIID